MLLCYVLLVKFCHKLIPDRFRRIFYILFQTLPNSEMKYRQPLVCSTRVPYEDTLDMFTNVEFIETKQYQLSIIAVTYSI